MHCQFALIVTGKGERDFLPSFFRSLPQRADCSFTVLRQIGQRSPLTSRKRQIKMVGVGKTIPDRDEQEIGLPARRYLRDQPNHFVVLVDDIEHDRRPQVADVFARYRTALDTMLKPDERQRAAVHFFANMLEAYYFADSAAVNEALGAIVLTADYAGDVEDIRHPKNDIKALHRGFDERENGAQIVASLDLNHVLDNPETCAFLRALFGWCIARLRDNADVGDDGFVTRYQLPAGRQAHLTKDQ
jgi:hypothetical protein